MSGRLAPLLPRLRALRVLVLPLVVLVGYTLCVQHSEKIKVGGGMGWDGVAYGRWAHDFSKVLSEGVNSYYVQRIFPSGLVYWALRALEVKRKNPQIIHAFEMANILLVALSALSYEAIARRLRVSSCTRWLGAIGLFGNFAILKYSAFYPVLTDVWAFALGTLQVQLYLSRRVYWLTAVTAVGAFTWPTLLPLGACLLLFSAASEEPAQLPAPAPAHLNDVAAGLATAVLLWACYSQMRPGLTLDNGTGVVDERYVALSALVAGGYTFWSVRQLLNQRQLFQPRAYLRALSLRSVLLTLVLLAAVLTARARLTSGKSRFGLDSTLNELVFCTLKEPGLFALAHVLVWGPLLLIVMFRWRQVVSAIHRAGLGPTLVALCGVLLSLHAESRKLANLAPFFYCLALPCLDRLALSRKEVVAFGAASLAYSRIWVEFDPRMKAPLSSFPAQDLFMVIGPWMTPTTYAIQLAIVVATGLVTLVWLRAREPASGALAPALVEPPARPAE